MLCVSPSLSRDDEISANILSGHLSLPPPRGRHRSHHVHPRDRPVRGSLNISTVLEKKGRKKFFHSKRWASLLQGNNLERKQFSQIVNVQISFWQQSDFRLQIVSLFSLSPSLESQGRRSDESPKNSTAAAHLYYSFLQRFNTLHRNVPERGKGTEQGASRCLRVRLPSSE